jgi:SAM-dependent methyltransferase
MIRQRFLFASVVFLASFLLFLVEPIAGRQLLPILGGSAAVWITCLVFFQTALLVGYLYAHWLARRPSFALYICLLLLAVATAILWVSRSMLMQNGAAHPVLTVFAGLTLSIGLPFLVLSATSPLLQVWWARVETGQIPYRLYALSNAASLLALIVYPTVIEPLFTLHTQRMAWCCGFVVFALLSAILAIQTRSATSTTSQAVTSNDLSLPPSPRVHKLLWVLLPMGAAMQLSAVTSHLTANLAPIPLLWILPLAVYLITLILAFQFRIRLPWSIIARVMVVVLAALAYSLTKADGQWPLWLSLLFFLVELFFACFFCHSAATQLRPQRASEATQFYLFFAAGGALGSFLIGIATPLLFRFNLDLPITFLVTALLVLAANWSGAWSQRLLWIVASTAMLVLVFWVHHAYEHHTIVAERNFYASLRVTEEPFTSPGTTIRTLANGSIRHGTQIFGNSKLSHIPTTYYSNDSGVGLALRFCCEDRARNIGVIGLGVGTLAAYGRAGDHIRFYDINPAVPGIAQNTFTYIRDSAAQIQIVEGDARNSLAQEPPQQFDVLVVDAFSGDAIPIHLLTTEALALYRRHLKPNGILAFHISNLHVDLEPAIALLADSAGMQARRVTNGSARQPGEFGSTWILVTADPDFFGQPELIVAGHMPKRMPGLKVWTDDYSALFPLIRW